MNIKKGTNIVAKHPIANREPFHYRVVVERLERDYYRLINMKSLMVMSGFKSENPQDAIKYIEETLDSEVLAIF